MEAFENSDEKSISIFGIFSVDDKMYQKYAF